jgi:rhamnulokinase
VELDAPVLSAASRDANFTNELGVDGRVRYLRNVMGLWLLQESMRGWGIGEQDLEMLLAAAARLPRGAVFDVDDPRLLPPGDMPAVGGGAQNALLCQLLADEAGLPVIAGPVEATAIGNLLVQARAYGTLTGDLDELRRLVRETQLLTRYEPRA